MTEYLTKSEAVKLIIDRVPKPEYENKRAWRNKISKRLNDKIKCGRIRIDKDGLLSLDDFLPHAYKWHDAVYFQDYPAPCGHGSAFLSFPTLLANGTGIELPDNIEELKALATKQHIEITRLNDIILQLQPDAERYRANCETNRNNSKKNQWTNKVHIF